MVFAEYAVLVEKFRWTPQQIGQLTETQIQQILFHKRNPKTGEIVWPGKFAGTPSEEEAFTTATDESAPDEKPFKMDGNVGDSTKDFHMEVRHDAKWTLAREKALIANLRFRPEFARELTDQKVAELYRQLDEKYAKMEADKAKQ